MEIEEDFDFAEMMAKIVMDVKRKKARRDAAQQAVERFISCLPGYYVGQERRDCALILIVCFVWGSKR